MGETSRALAGKRIVITRSAEESEPLAALLRAYGAVAVILPLLAFEPPKDWAPLDAAMVAVQKYDWIIFTSGQAVRAVMNRARELQLPSGAVASGSKCAAVGPGTAATAKSEGFRVEYVAETHNGLALVQEMGSRVKGCAVLLPRSDRASPDLPAALKQQGAIVSEVVAYRTTRPQDVDEGALTAILSGEADAILFYSPSAVHHFEEIVGRSRFQVLQETMAITAVGPVTAAALGDTGVQRIQIAADPTNSAVIEALENHFSAGMNPTTAGAKRA